MDVVDRNHDSMNSIDEVKNKRLAYKIKFILSIENPYKESLLQWLLHNPINPDIDTAVVNTLNKEFGRGLSMPEHIEQQEAELKQQLQSTQFQLKSYLNNSLRESIRMSYYSLADIYLKAGSIDHALNAYLQTRDHISSSAQLVETHTHIISLAIQLRNYALIKNSIIKINSIAINDIDSDTLLIPSAVADLGQGNYASVVDSLTKLSASASHPLIPASDITLYLALCALATQSRQEIKEKILDNDALRSKFEFEPHTKHLLHHFVASEYKALFGLLDENKWAYLLDPHMHSQYEQMVDAIYKRCIVQYFESFTCISLNNLIKTFGDDGILNTTLKLIKSSQLNLRYDAVNHVFHKASSDTRTNLLNKAVAVSESNHKATKQLVYRMKLSNAKLVLNERSERGAGGAGGSGGKKEPRKEARQRRNSDQLDDDEEDDGEEGSSKQVEMDVEQSK
ncbi:hypothetical protein E3P99_02855 [Wallemia hederae]|uniref:26S proteasome regulatory subunit Rpn7 N-terminal domain-containing protein n=1 Tax=Wallemia hederae TaxID=1540922 RepID=A0A4T0FHU5_9BASI|nr:hypothetical protein E3P99_02855 [Wallemia hederae]